MAALHTAAQSIEGTDRITGVSLLAPRRTAWWHWKPTSERQAEEAEREMLSALTIPYELREVSVGDTHIHTLVAGRGPPLLLLHGMGAGLALWVKTIEALSSSYTVHALDWPGFGRSGRPAFRGTTPEDAEQYFLGRLESWREAVGLDQLTVVGHSMGAYLAARYALRSPERVRRVVLADPWGIPERPPVVKPPPLLWRAVGGLVTQFTPLAVLRALGPWGPGALAKVRADITAKFAHIYPDPKVVMFYIYHCNAANPTGEEAFATMALKLGWAKRPLVHRIHDLGRAVELSFIYGAHTWMDRALGQRLAQELSVPCSVVPRSGHHVYLDNFPGFINALTSHLKGT
eukprot:RCo030395